MIIVISWNVGKYDRTKLTLNMKGIEKNWRGILNKVIQDFSQFGSGSTSVGSPNAMHELEVILDILQQLVSFSLSCKGVGNSNSNLESLHLPDMKFFLWQNFFFSKQWFSKRWWWLSHVDPHLSDVWLKSGRVVEVTINMSFTQFLTFSNIEQHIFSIRSASQARVK